MEGYISLGLLCILYYLYLAWYTKRFDSTFAWFWIVFGVVQIGLGLLVNIAPDWIASAMMAVSGLWFLIFFAIEILILCGMAALPHKKADYIIILGAQIRGKKITGSLKRRLDKGIQYLEKNPQTICIVSGGQGKGEEISEAQAMAEYLKVCGVEEDRILMENQSTTTCENFVFSRALIRDLENNKIGIISNNFHIYRAMKMAKALGYRKVFAIPATTNLVLFPNYMVREFFAFFIMFAELRKHE